MYNNNNIYIYQQIYAYNTKHTYIHLTLPNLSFDIKTYKKEEIFIQPQNHLHTWG